MGTSNVIGRGTPPGTVADTIGVDLLGTVRACRDGVELALGGPKPTTIVALLALNAGHVVAVDQLAGALWDEELPDDVPGTVQVYVSRLRKVLDVAGQPSVVQWRAPGYLLTVPVDATDVGRFETGTAGAVVHAGAGRLMEASAELTAALGLWRGRALADLSDQMFAAAPAARLEAARWGAIELRIDVDLRLGRHESLIPELEALVVDQPLHERLWASLMLALYRAGRTADALSTYQRVRGVLADELGLDPGPELRELEAAVLAGSVELLRPDAGRPDGDLTMTAGGARPVPAGAWLTYADGTSVEITRRRWVIGRSPDSDVVISDPRASRRHALINASATGFELIDLASTNGTQVNGTTVTPGVPLQLVDGDLCVVADSAFTFSNTRK